MELYFMNMKLFVSSTELNPTIKETSHPNSLTVSFMKISE
jgi:hypothetical protein